MTEKHFFPEGEASREEAKDEWMRRRIGKGSFPYFSLLFLGFLSPGSTPYSFDPSDVLFSWERK